MQRTLTANVTLSNITVSCLSLLNTNYKINSLYRTSFMLDFKIISIVVILYTVS